MKSNKDLLLFSVGAVAINSFLFGFALFILSKLQSLSDFEYAILATLFFFSTMFMVYVLKEFYATVSMPIKRFRHLIENSMHELNTPVATIKTNTAILKKGGDEEVFKKCLRIEAACDKLFDLYEDLEYFAKKEAKIEEKTVVSVKQTLLKELSLQEWAIAKKEINIVCNLEEGSFLLDKKGLSLATANILSNAVKFAPVKSSISITFQNGKLTVKDEGEGIAEDKLIKIFDRYYQDDRNKEGKGIGLFLVKEFCDANGVELFIVSKEGEGSEFTLDFDKIRKKS